MDYLSLDFQFLSLHRGFDVKKSKKGKQTIAFHTWKDFSFYMPDDASGKSKPGNPRIKVFV